MIKTIDRLKSLLSKQAELTKKIYPHPEWQHNSFEELILNCGVEFTICSPNQIKLNRSEGCYQNCQNLVKEYPEFTYCEGYALASDVIIPVRHAWLINTHQEVIEPTWNDNDSIYLGIPFSASWFQSILNRRSAIDREDEISILEGDYIEDFFLLSEGLPDEAISTSIIYS